MKRYVKLTITHLTNEDAGAMVGLIPQTAEFKLETEERKNGKAPSDGPRKRGTTGQLLRHMATNGDIYRTRASKLVRSYGARNPSAQISVAITKGYIHQTKGGLLKLTAEGKTKAKEDN